jgi:polar amino acid transport system substrate-binding protein
MRFRSRRILTAVLGWVLGFLTVAAVAADTNPGESAPLRVGVSPVFPPMIFKQGKELAGVEVDFARALGEKLGRKVVFVEIDWKDQTESLTAGKIDIIMSSMSMTPARQARIAFSAPYLQISQMALARTDEQYRFALGFPKANKVRLGVKKGTTGDFLVQREYPKARRKTFVSGEEAAQALLAKEIDLFISDSTLIYWLGGTHESQGLAVAPMVFNQEYLAWGLRKSDTATLESVNRFIAKARQSGELDRILKRWIPTP